ncbi:MAG: PhnD/SsuA/transferrin family substrate-binding protein, partial [Rhizobiales bacterium]|nr:PhnD/SsuA/transferrin family substrate-binding protein [Hyphomicrobiales bacterium]
MLASLPMYDWPEIRPATDAWWAAIARHAGLGFPLTRADDYAALWRRDDLIFSQTCGYPFTHGFAGNLNLIATPHYDTEGCVGPGYSSFVFARARPPRLSDLAGSIAAVNAPDSMSGMLALKLVFAPLAKSGRFFRGAIATGSHIASLQAVRDGTADVCAIDAVCVGLARRYRPDYLDGLVEIARSPGVPGLPYVTSVKTSPDLRERLRVGLEASLADPAL